MLNVSASVAAAATTATATGEASAGNFAQKYNLNVHSARIIYVTKEGYANAPIIKEWGLADWAKSSMKEYFVERNDSFTDKRMDLAMSYRKWRDGFDAGGFPKLPPRAEKATSADCTRCKRCPVKKECWT